MLKTNSKQARANVRNYIINNYTGDSYGWDDAKTFEEIAQAIMTAFYMERAKPLVEDKHYFPTYQDAFTIGVPVFLPLLTLVTSITGLPLLTSVVYWMKPLQSVNGTASRMRPTC